VSPRRWDFISENCADFGVQRICRVLGVSRAGYYRHLATEQARAERRAEEKRTVSEIRAIHAEHQGAYGAPRVHAELRARGRRINRKRVTRLMRINHIVGRHLRRKKRTTIADRTALPVPDLVMRDFTADTLNTRWCGDITYIAVGGTWLYLATVIDICSRRVVGWSIADHMRTSLVTDAIEMAVAARGGPVRGVVFHTDRGAQGGFNRSLQHLVLGGVDGQASRVDGGVDRAVADEVPGCAGASAGSGTSVLAGDREGVARRGGGSCGWRIPGGGLQVVPSRWRHATNGSCSAVRPVPVLSRA
jgi:hypothetical protein